jgi:hypothetical protein
VKANLFLACGILLKYICAPLLLISFMRLLQGKRTAKSLLPPLLLPLMLGVGVFALFVRDTRFLDSMAEMRGWDMYSIKHGAQILNPLLGWPASRILGRLLEMAFMVFAGIALIRMWKRPSLDTTRDSCIAILSVNLYLVAGHIWPWFLIWGLSLGALRWETRLARWTVGVALSLPFAFIYSSYAALPTDSWLKSAIVACAFLFAAAWTFFTRNSAIPSGVAEPLSTP